MIIRKSKYDDAVNSYMGWCTECKDFTRKMTEPDAEGYDCPNCGENSVMGAEQALICEEFEIGNPKSVLSKYIKRTKNMSPDDKKYLYHHFRAYLAHSVPDDLQDEFESFAIQEIEEDPEYWMQSGWPKLYHEFLDSQTKRTNNMSPTVKIPASKLDEDELIERAINKIDEAISKLETAERYFRMSKSNRRRIITVKEVIRTLKSEFYDETYQGD